MLYLNVLQLIWHYFLLPFYYNLLHSYCNLLLLLFFTAVYYFLLQVTTFLPQVTTSADQNFLKKNLPKITTIYCNFTAIYNNNLLHLVVLQLYFLLFRHRNTDYFLLRYTTIYCILTAIYCLYYFLLQFTASYRDLPQAQWEFRGPVFRVWNCVTEKWPQFHFYHLWRHRWIQEYLSLRFTLLKKQGDAPTHSEYCTW